MKSTRRSLMKAGLGISQVALMERLGVPLVSARKARAASSNTPTKLLTIYVPGGWMPSFLWVPLSPLDITRFIPAPENASGEPYFYLPSQVSNMDGSGDADLGAPYQRLRTARLWNEAALLAGNEDPRTTNPLTGVPTSPHGWSWMHHQLFNDCTVVHGIDQGTAAHESGKISAMCGAAGSEYRAPGIHSVVANAFYARYADTRPLPCVAIGDGPVPHPLGLPAIASPTIMQTIASLEDTLSERNDDAWLNLRSRQMRPQLDFLGNPAGSISTNAMDEQALRSIRSRRGLSSRGTDTFLRKLYEGYQGVSKVLARDVVSTLTATPGVEHTPHPFWGFGEGHFGVDMGRGNNSDSGGTWDDRFQLTLKLLKTDLTSAISLYCPGTGNFYFDTHGEGWGGHFGLLRGVWDNIGRLLGEMKATPITGGRTLLDDTLVIIFSEFARTWPKSGSSDHWPTTSVAFVGGGVTPNRMVGNYDVDGHDPGSLGFTGRPVELIEEGGESNTRPPRSGDVIHTALKVLGIHDFFIPGGTGEIVGVRA